MAHDDGLHAITLRALQLTTSGSAAFEGLRAELVVLQGPELRVATHQLLVSSRALFTRGAHDAARAVAELARAAVGPLRRAVGKKSDLAASGAANYRRFSGERRPAMLAKKRTAGRSVFQVRCDAIRGAR